MEVSNSVSFVYGEPSQIGKNKVWERLLRIDVGRKDFWGMVGISMTF